MNGAGAKVDPTIHPDTTLAGQVIARQENDRFRHPSVVEVSTRLFRPAWNYFATFFLRLAGGRDVFKQGSLRSETELVT